MHSSCADTRWSAEHPARATPDRAAAADQVARMRQQLHDLAQPLTALECVLFLGTLHQGEEQGGLRETIDDALVQCGRLMVGMRAMQESLQD